MPSLAVVSPWPPQRNGIADYAYELACASQEDLVIVTEAARPQPARASHLMVGAETFLAQRSEQKTPTIYHVGNNPDHAFLAPIFLRRPGVVVLHDLSLQYLCHYIERLLPGFTAAQLRTERPDIVGLFQRLGVAGLLREIDHREIRLLGWLRAAPAVIVHSQAARRTVQAALPGTPIHVVGHFCYLTGLSFEALGQWREAIRRQMAWLETITFSGPPFVVVSLGFPTADKQFGSVMRAIARMPPPCRSRVALLIAGQVRVGDPDPMAQAIAHGCADRVRTLGWVEETDAARLLVAADIVLALRFPARGESSGAVARALGLGCATVVLDHGAYADLPEYAVIKLPARIDVSEPLQALLSALVDDPSRLGQVRRGAYAYAHAHGDPTACAEAQARIARGEA